MTLQQQRLLTLNIELRFSRLITIAYASRINTLDNALNNLRQFHLKLLHNSIIANNVYCRMRSHQSDAVNFPRTERTTFNLHDILNAQMLARNINRDSHNSLLTTRNPQNLHHVQRVTAVNVINNRAILDLGNAQFFIANPNTPPSTDVILGYR
jgi:hypothetical protein